MTRKKTKCPIWESRKAYYKLHNNYYGLLKHDMLTPNEKKIMFRELKYAEHEWKEAEEKYGKK